jgi:hypothetical protein
LSRSNAAKSCTRSLNQRPKNDPIPESTASASDRSGGGREHVGPIGPP